MEKKRVEFGEDYYFIDLNMQINCECELHSGFESELFKADNYFATEEQAEAMANKIKAVLAGADVIEMPSEKEIESAIPTYADRPAEFSAGIGNGWWQCIEWLKSKIIK